jgi:tRNA-modifying protein YgfZ
MDLNELIYADRSERGKLRFTGPQRAWFLHQIMTNDFENLGPGEHRDAALLTAHGRMVGYLEAVADENAIWTHFEPELRDSLPEAIRRYVFATQVDIADVTGDYGQVLVAGPGWYELAGAAAPHRLRHPTQSLGVPAGYVWVERAGTQDLLDALKLEARAAGEEELEEIRIAGGIARWGRDMNEKTIPQEARIEGIAVHFDKGCYVGQEAMAKIHFRGKVNRQLRKLEAPAHLPVGSDVMLDGAKVGTITSSSRGRALGILRYTVEPGSVVDVGGEQAKVVA